MKDDFRNHITGAELNDAYARILCLINVDGPGDGGRDIADSEDISKQTEYYQVKSSVAGAKHSLGLSLKYGEFIPLLVGEPGTEDEIRDSVDRFGAYVEPGLPEREDFLEGCAKVRSYLCD